MLEGGGFEMESICNGVALGHLEVGMKDIWGRCNLTKMAGAAIRGTAEKSLAEAEGACWWCRMGKMRAPAARDLRVPQPLQSHSIFLTVGGGIKVSCLV